MEISKILKPIIRDIKESNICDSLVLFGSAVYSKKPQDIDLILYKKDFIEPLEFLQYIKLIDKLNEKYQDIGFAFSPGKSKKKEYKVEVSILPYFNFMIKYEKNFVKDIHFNHKILFGRNPFVKYEKLVPSDFISSIILLDQNNVNNYYFKIKCLLRDALAYKGLNLKKEELIGRFEEMYNCNLSKEFKEAHKGKMVDYNTNIFKKEYNNISNLVKKRILKDNPQLKNRMYYPEKYLKIMQIYRDLRVLYEKENFKTIEDYIPKKQKEYEKE